MPLNRIHFFSRRTQQKSTTYSPPTPSPTRQNRQTDGFSGQKSNEYTLQIKAKNKAPISNRTITTGFDADSYRLITGIVGLGGTDTKTIRNTPALWL